MKSPTSITLILLIQQQLLASPSRNGAEAFSTTRQPAQQREFGIVHRGRRRHQNQRVPTGRSTRTVGEPILDGAASTAWRPRSHFAFSAPATTTTTTALGCQIMGMSCRTATEMSLSWPTFCERGGGTDVHADGWGLAYYPDGQNGLRQFHDVEAASTSPLAQFLGRQSIKTSNMMAHIRYATSGEVDLANVHPFSREMWGLNWAFCHNGQIPLMDDNPNYCLGGGRGSSGEARGERFYSPIGNTDSEAMFCALLNALRGEFKGNMPSLPALYESIQRLCQEVVDYDRDGTILNFLLTCGPYNLWVFSWPGSRPGSSVWNGLHYTVRNNSTKMADDDYTFNLKMSDGDNVNGDSNCALMTGAVNGDSSAAVGNEVRDCDDDSCCESCCIVATKPLTTDEEWIELKRGELILFDEGLPHVSPKELFHLEFNGHGLDHAGRAEIQRPRLQEDLRRYEFNEEFFAAGGI